MANGALSAIEHRSDKESACRAKPGLMRVLVIPNALALPSKLLQFA